MKSELIRPSLIMFIHEIREQRNKAITSRQVAALGRRGNKTIQTSEMGNRASTNRIRAVPAGMIGLYEKRGGGQASSLPSQASIAPIVGQNTLQGRLRAEADYG